MKVKLNKYLNLSLQTTSKVLVVTCSLLLLPTTHAAKNDLNEEITIKSQRQSADLKNKIASYLDKVSIRQGSISISADLVKVFSSVDKTTNEKSDTYLAKGKPAVFQQELEDGNIIILQADEITYTPDSNIITVSGNALVKQAGSEVSGELITFNTLSEKLEAKSAENQSITTVLQPTILKKQQEAHEKPKVESATEVTTQETSEVVTDNKGENNGN
ncbi:lipopolysaccharide transport periplasmic protein LptA [Colwellia sp. E2M01]|uniref:lipopolysaccharide transport periplasmic protein LptA n=1 Tax=Colwellia sp. E2M01 TaxID=2841561 RepID=UPI001C090F8F|nr:lipopolysaccharide transport periplasmic protein LptA [Colwellia sp. E2M01]MBU2870280.1 lipopolysaccharide transport periplasmic protein LptA [Colwellia sp. E2M01]